jgi:hypothetical protein
MAGGGLGAAASAAPGPANQASKSARDSAERPSSSTTWQAQALSVCATATRHSRSARSRRSGALVAIRWGSMPGCGSASAIDGRQARAAGVAATV